MVKLAWAVLQGNQARPEGSMARLVERSARLYLRSANLPGNIWLLVSGAAQRSFRHGCNLWGMPG